MNIDLTLSKIAWKNLSDKEGTPTAIALQTLILQLTNFKQVFFVEGYVLNPLQNMRTSHTWIEINNRVVDPFGYAQWKNELESIEYFPSYKIWHQHLNHFLQDSREPLHKQHRELAERMVSVGNSLPPSLL